MPVYDASSPQPTAAPDRDVRLPPAADRPLPLETQPNLGTYLAPTMMSITSGTFTVGTLVLFW